MNSFKMYRKRENFTQENVANILGVDRSTVAKWETGKAKPKAALLPAISKLYKCSIDDLFGGKQAS